ncbi:serine--tRNA ligase [Candidatus Poribacteria bacterium]|nr:serine--tRNA ligase [Candidatus Poribacteria bacterium]MXV85018.1 serine--tRNA ligase [Candidatus Poribacteria bacterium]MYA57252.1 serine--tRNA ligase [Candidatus Poribacteria bacterium]
MIDLKFIRENTEDVRQMLADRRTEAELDRLVELDACWRENLTHTQSLKAHQNQVSQQIAERKKAKQDATETIAEMRKLSQEIKELTAEANATKTEIDAILLTIPNMPEASTPVGMGEDDNIEIKTWGELPSFDFELKPHWEIAEQLDIVDFQRGAKVAGSNFVLFKGVGARLERALIQFMLDLHTTQHGYTEISPPFLANRPTMTGTGQIPKLESDMYRCDRDEENPDSDLFLIPTAEVPVTNMFSGEILAGDELPIYYTAYTPCFRREAGAYGKDTRGLQRIHQFDKVEMVKFTTPEASYAEHETLLANAESVLQALGLPYRVVQHCTVELSFAAAKCYDIEVWAPARQRFLEVSSCSNFEDFQARRASIRFRREAGARPEFVHTLNASGTALPRVVIALLETYQNPDGTVRIPAVLQPYMGGLKQIGCIS